MELKTKKSGLLILMVLLLVGVVALSGCIGGQKTEDLQTIGEAVKTKQGITLCGSLSRDDRYACKNAITNEDVSLCNEMSASGKEVCIAAVAEAKEDVSLCNEISATSNKDWCIALVARAKQNATLCKKIAYGYIKEECIEGAS